MRQPPVRGRNAGGPRIGQGEARHGNRRERESPGGFAGYPGNPGNPRCPRRHRRTPVPAGRGSPTGRGAPESPRHRQCLPIASLGGGMRRVSGTVDPSPGRPPGRTLCDLRPGKQPRVHPHPGHPPAEGPPHRRPGLDGTNVPGRSRPVSGCHPRSPFAFLSGIPRESDSRSPLNPVDTPRDFL